MGLACCADIVLATDDARFALSETGLGLIPAQIAPFVQARVGRRVALRLGLSGEIDKVGGRTPLDERAVHGQAADTGIEDANGHELALALRPPGVHAVHYSPFM